MAKWYFQENIHSIEERYLRDYKELEVTICRLKKDLDEMLDDFKDINNKRVSMCQEYDDSGLKILSLHIHRIRNSLQNSKVSRNEFIIGSIEDTMNKLSTDNKQ